jgi:hypothetical protein
LIIKNNVGLAFHEEGPKGPEIQAYTIEMGARKIAEETIIDMKKIYPKNEHAKSVQLEIFIV